MKLLTLLISSLLIGTTVQTFAQTQSDLSPYTCTYGKINGQGVSYAIELPQNEASPAIVTTFSVSMWHGVVSRNQGEIHPAENMQVSKTLNGDVILSTEDFIFSFDPQLRVSTGKIIKFRDVVFNASGFHCKAGRLTDEFPSP